MESEPVTKSRMKDRESGEVLKILHVDDNTKFINLVEKYLKRSQKNFEIKRAKGPKEALEILSENKIDCILSDYKMPDKDGLELLRNIRDRYGEIPFILLTGNGSEEIASKAMSEGATDYFKKKGKFEDYEVLAQRIQNAVSSYQAKYKRKRTLKRIHQGFINLDKDYNIKYVNKKAREQLNLSEKSYKGNKFWKEYEKDSSLKEKIQKAFEEQVEVETSHYNTLHSKWFYVHIYPSEDSVSIYLRDITKKKAFQRQNKAQMKQQKVLADLGQRIVKIDDKEALLEEVGEAIWKGINCEKLEIDGEDIHISKGDAKTQLSSYTLDIELDNRNWGYLKVENTEKLTKSDEEFLNSIKSLLSNSIKRLNREKESKQLKRLFESVNDFIYLVDSDENLEYINKASKGLQRFEKGGMEDQELFTNVRKGKGDIRQEFEKIKNGEKDEGKVNHLLRTEDGDEVPVESSFTDFEFEDGSIGRVGITRDISERECKRKQLKKYQKIVEAADDGFYVTNSQSEIEIVNKAFLEIVDKPREEVVGRDITDVLELQIEDCKRLEEMVYDGETIEEQGKLKRDEKEPLYYENTFKPLYPEKDDFEGVLGIIKDITGYEERKKGLKESKEKSKKRVERLVENLPGAAYRIEEKDGEWELTSISDGVEDLLGSSADQILDEGWRELIFEEDISKVEEKLESGGADSNAVKFRIQNGQEVRWILSKASPVDDEEKNVLEGVIIDITDWKEYQRDLERTQALLEAAPEPMIILDDDFNVEKVNRASREFFNVEKDDLSSLSFDKAAKNIFDANKDKISEAKLRDLDPKKFLKQKSQMEELKKDLKKFIEDDEKEDTTIETEINVPTEEKMYGRVELRKLYDEDGETAGLASVIHDITEMEKKRRSQRNKLDEFSSLVSHDLRNPLNLAQGYLDLARESESEEDFEVIEKAHVRMENIIDELLLITTEKEEIEKEKVDIKEVFEEAFYFSGSKNLEYHVEDEMEIYADRSGLVSIFENLVSNSEEHNEGDIEVRVGKTDRGFYYEDTGKGVPEDIRDEIFEYGVSSDTGGVGLSIVKRIADISGWKVKLKESDEGGARFEFEI